MVEVERGMAHGHTEHARVQAKQGARGQGGKRQSDKMADGKAFRG